MSHRCRQMSGNHMGGHDVYARSCRLICECVQTPETVALSRSESHDVEKHVGLVGTGRVMLQPRKLRWTMTCLGATSKEREKCPCNNSNIS